MSKVALAYASAPGRAWLTAVRRQAVSAPITIVILSTPLEVGLSKPRSLPGRPVGRSHRRSQSMRRRKRYNGVAPHDAAREEHFAYEEVNASD
jgi:hypothetical protein